MSAAADPRVAALARLRDIVNNLTEDHRPLMAYLDGPWEDDKDLLVGDEKAIMLVERVGRRNGLKTLGGKLYSALKPRRGGGKVVSMDGKPRLPRQPFAVPGMPKGSSVPHGYAVTSDGLWWTGSDDHKLIAKRLMVPTGLFRDVASGAFHVRVTWDVGEEEWPAKVVSRGVVSEARRIVQLSESGAPVDSVCASDIVRWMTVVQTDCDLPITAAASVLGWQEDGRSGFLWGHNCIGGEVHLLAEDGTDQLADGFRSAGSLDGWRKAWDLVEPYPTVSLAVYAAIAPVLIGLIREAPTFTVDWSGKQQGGKTTLLQLAASVWGDPTAIISQWAGSPTGIERTLELHRHLPTMLDDTKHASKDEFVTETLYRVTGRRGKMRGKPDGMRRTAELRTVLLSTGERAATTFTEDAGARSRCLAIEGPPFGGEGQQVSESVQVLVMDHHGHVGPMIVKYLLSIKDRWPALNESWVAHRTKMTERANGADGRGSAYLATLLLAAEVLREACGLPIRYGVIDEAEKWAAVAAKNADRPLEALRWVWSWLDGNYQKVSHTDPSKGALAQDRMSLPNGEIIAVWPEGEPPAVIWNALKRDLAKDGIAIEDVESEWVRRGWIMKERTKGYVRRELRPWVRAFTVAAVEAVDGE